MITSFDKDHDTIVVDGIQLRQVIENLIDNALDAMPEGGTLSITTSCVPGDDTGIQGDVFEIRVEDTGGGINEDDISHIFLPFFTRKSKGTGLGLALVQKIVDMHHGQAEATNIEGGGARFVIRLPLESTSFTGRKS